VVASSLNQRLFTRGGVPLIGALHGHEPDRGGETGGITKRRKTPCIVTVGGSVASGANVCSVSAGNFSNDRLPICTKPEQCNVSTCEVIRTS
jgi:hypothetical protein